LMGVVIALNPIVGHHYGAGRHHEIGKSFVQGLWLALGLALLGAILLGFPDVWLQFSHVEPAVRDRVALYLRALTFALPAALLFRTVYALNTALSRPKVVMSINLLILCFKFPLNYILIFGKFGVPAYGAAGCGIATAIVMWLACAIGFGYVLTSRHYEAFQFRFAWPSARPLAELLRLGVPTGLSYIVEVTSFTFMALLVARLGPQVTGGHQITANLAALCFMVPLSLAVASSTLIAQHLGAGDVAAARTTAGAGLTIATVCALLVSGAILLARNQIISLYTSDPGVAKVAASLVLYLAAFHVFDALQGVAGFALRAYKRAVVPVLVYTLSLWGLGLGGGFVLAFHGLGWLAPMGAAGLWACALVGLIVAAAALLFQLERISRKAVLDRAI
jgi:multidrug resistance protein, MATE family